MENTFLYIFLESTGNFMGLTFFPIIIIFSIIKLWEEKKTANSYNIIRLILLNVFIITYFLNFLEFLYETLNFQQFFLEFSIWSESLDSFSLRIVMLGIIVSFGLGLVIYANQWEILYYSQWFFYGGMLVLYFLNGSTALFPIYIIISGIIGVIFLFYTGLKIKDNGSLGLGIFFMLQFITIIFEYGLFTDILNIISFTFVLIFGLGYFKPFKEGEI